ncbi:MAG: hypothetical protein WC965_01955 [Thiohalomonadaceae bacterium]
MLQRLSLVDSRNPKEIVIEGLREKVASLGELSVPFVFTMDYPSKETFVRYKDGDEVAERRIVVRRLDSSVANYAIGMTAAADNDYLYDGSEERYQGWVDSITIEISVWTTASDDRDNIMELIKIWMLELEQDNIDTDPFFYTHGIQAVRYIRSKEESNQDIVQNGVMYIGTLTYTMLATFFNMVERDDLLSYKIALETRIQECIGFGTSVKVNG